MKESFDAAKTKKNIKIDAVGVGVPVGAAEIYDTESRSFKDSKELAKYNADLAYVYKNRDTII